MMDTNLLCDKFRRRAMHPINTGGVLDCQRRYDAGSVAPVRCEGPKISLFSDVQQSGRTISSGWRPTWMPAPPLESEPAIVKTAVTVVDIAAA